jgi:hypothetical protein
MDKKSIKWTIFVITGMLCVISVYFSIQNSSSSKVAFPAFGLANSVMGLVLSHQQELPEEPKAEDFINLLGQKACALIIEELSKDVLEHGVNKVSLYIAKDVNSLKRIYENQTNAIDYAPIVIELMLGNKREYVIRNTDGGCRLYSEKEFNKISSLANQYQLVVSYEQ